MLAKKLYQFQTLPGSNQNPVASIFGGVQRQINLICYIIWFDFEARPATSKRRRISPWT